MELLFSQIKVGDNASFDCVIDEQLVADFTNVSGDKNPLHVDSGYAQTTHFEKRIAHGMIIGALFSRLVGMHLPGKYALYLSQTMEFRQPIFIGTKIKISGVVEQKVESQNILKIKTTATIVDKVCVSGVALVRMLK